MFYGNKSSGETWQQVKPKTKCANYGVGETCNCPYLGIVSVGVEKADGTLDYSKDRAFNLTHRSNNGELECE